MVVARAIAAADPRAEIRIASGSVDEIARATVAVMGGGLSSYEACAVGAPTAGIPVVPRHQKNVRAFARQGAAVAMPLEASGRSTAATVVALVDHPHRRAQLRRRSMRLIDGKGDTRAAAAVLLFVHRKRS